MQNLQNPQVFKCQCHNFSLKAFQKEKRPNLNASATMCKGKQTKNKKAKGTCSNYEGPVLNKDRCHATLSFILPSERIQYLQGAREILREHERRVKQYEEQLDDLFVPKPKSKNMYCNVCRQNYQDYLDHIYSIKHKASIKSSDFNRHIVQLTKKFKKADSKDLTLVSTEITSREESENSVEIIGSTGRKIVKANTEQTVSGEFYPFMNQQLTYPYSYGLPVQQNLYNSLGLINNNRALFDSYITSVSYNPFNVFLQQPTMTHPFFCMPFQPNLPLEVFQHQG